MVKNNTTHEQAEKLIELGIDVNTADMHFHRVPNPNYDWDMQCYGYTFFDCVYNAVCWLLETKLI